jgi:hypothetical protein
VKAWPTPPPTEREETRFILICSWCACSGNSGPR